MKRRNVIAKAVISLIALLCIFCVSCWNGLNDAYNNMWEDKAPGEVRLKNDSEAKPNAVKLSWEEPTDKDFDNVKITLIGGALSVTKIYPKGTTDTTSDQFPALSNIEYTITIKSIDLLGNESAGLSFKYTRRPAALILLI